MQIKAMSKVNLALDVIRRRDDGYHEVKMVMQTLQLCDELTINLRDDELIKIESNIDELECDESNLIYKAAKLIMDYSGVHRGFDIYLQKNIPIAAGMAGGSTDCAATLVAINELLELNLSIDKLKELGVQIGADVPYCIEGGTQLSEGIGERLTKISNAPQCYVVVAKPHDGVSTKYVYENLHVDTIQDHPDVDAMIRAIENDDIKGVAAKMDNILENVTIVSCPVIKKIKDILKVNGALNAIMSGSGPTVFGLFEEEKIAQHALDEVIKTGEISQGFVTTFSEKTCVLV